MEFFTLITWWVLLSVGAVTMFIYQIGRNLQIDQLLYLGGIPVLVSWVLGFVLTGWVGGIVLFLAIIPTSVIIYLLFLATFKRS